jgi:hypothetical protein
MGWDTADGALQKSIFYEFSMSMIRVYFKLILPVALIFLTVSLIARALGTTQPPNPALHGFTEGCEDKPQPCWYGIVPEKTTMEEAITMLNQRDDLIRLDNYLFRQSGNQGCVFSLWGGDIISNVDITKCPETELGDIVNWFDSPNYTLTGTLFFRNGLFMVAEQHDPKICFKLTPRSKVEFITVTNNQIETTLPIWYGFKPYWWYVKQGRNTPCVVIHSPGY